MSPFHPSSNLLMILNGAQKRVLLKRARTYFRAGELPRILRHHGTGILGRFLGHSWDHPALGPRDHSEVGSEVSFLAGDDTLGMCRARTALLRIAPSKASTEAFRFQA
jgi:hypothetical protein